MARLCVIITLLFSVLYSEAYKSYENYKVIQIVPKNRQQLEAIQLVKERALGDGITLDFWRHPSKVNASIDVMIDAKDMTVLNRFLYRNNIQSKIIVDNVQKLIDGQMSHIDQSSRVPFKAGDDPASFPIDQYHPIAEINDWIDSLASSYPSLVSTFSIGSSHENRDMRVIKIGAQGTKKPGYFIDAGIHAREWITVSTAVYIINELVTKYDTNPTYKEYLDKLDFFILPSVNPDGYQYTIDKDRMWRKTRSGPYGALGCIGVDPNRNFGYHWGESGGGTDPCGQTYAGPKAFSEIETSNLANYLLSHNDTLKAYLTLHSYSDLFMYEYGYKPNTYPPDVDDLKALANDAVAAIAAVHGTKFTAGNSDDLTYDAAGASDDWSKGVANIKWVYTLELRPGDGDVEHDTYYGFDLPPSYIIPVGEETWAGLQVIANKIISG